MDLTHDRFLGQITKSEFQFSKSDDEEEENYSLNKNDEGTGTVTPGRVTSMEPIGLAKGHRITSCHIS